MSPCWGNIELPKYLFKLHTDRAARVVTWVEIVLVWIQQILLSVRRVRVYSLEWLEKGVGEQQRESLLKFSLCALPNLFITVDINLEYD